VQWGLPGDELWVTVQWGLAGDGGGRLEEWSVGVADGKGDTEHEWLEAAIRLVAARRVYAGGIRQCWQEE
jgi:hypothetical protein